MWWSEPLCKRVPEWCGNKQGHIVWYCSGENGSCVKISLPTLSPCKEVHVPLPVIGIQVNDVQCSEIIGTECSRLIISAHFCQSWREAMRRCNGQCPVHAVELELWITQNKIIMLVVQEKPLGNDLLLGINAIHALVGTVITPAGDVQFGRKEESCAAIYIDEPVLLLITKRKPGLLGGSGSWMKYQCHYRIPFQNTKYQERSGLLTKKSCKQEQLGSPRSQRWGSSIGPSSLKVAWRSTVEVKVCSSGSPGHTYMP